MSCLLGNYIGELNGPIRSLRSGGLFIDIPPQYSTPGTGHARSVRRQIPVVAIEAGMDSS